MKKTIIYFAIMLLFSAYATAQNYEPIVNLSYEQDGTLESEEISLQDGEIVIYNNDLDFLYDSNPSKNRNFEFDKVKKLVVSNKPRTFIEELFHNSNFEAFIDKDSQLHISSDKELGRVSVYSISGSMIVDFVTSSNKATVDMSNISQGVYIIRCGVKTVKVIK